MTDIRDTGVENVDEIAAQLGALHVSSPKAVQKTSELILELMQLSKKNPKLVKSTPHQVQSVLPNGTIKTREIRSWKMNEFKYYDIPSPFPTLARGLFTQEIKLPGKKVRHRIVARGYDKFFNIGEVPWNTVSLASAFLPETASDISLSRPLPMISEPSALRRGSNAVCLVASKRGLSYARRGCIHPRGHCEHHREPPARCGSGIS